MRLSHLVKDVGGMALYYPGQALLARAPRSLVAHAARVGGDAVRSLSDTEGAREELSLLFGDRPMPQPVEVVLREAWRQSMFNELEVLRYARLTPETVGQVCTIEGREHLDAALSEGKGAIVLIGHFGANQMVMPALGYSGYAMNQLSAPPTVWAEIQPERNTPLWSKVLARRWALEQRLPVQHINVFDFIRPAVRCLQQNQVLGLAFDGGGGKRWTQVPLVSRTANVNRMPERLARVSGAAILPTLVLRRPGEKRHTVRIHEPVDSLQAFARVFSRYVEQDPAHYLNFLMLRRRMKHLDEMPFFTD
jgi:phosphatidylinositol dimannoside acyltransferase